MVCAALGRLLRRRRRFGSAAVTAGLIWCSTALVGIVRVDARSATSCTGALIALVEHALERSGGERSGGAATPTGRLAATAPAP